WPQARPRDRHHAGHGTRTDAAGRTHPGHGPRGRRPRHATDQAGGPGPHHPDGRTQHERGVLHRRHHHRAGARFGAGGRPLRRSVAPSGRHAGLHGNYRGGTAGSARMSTTAALEISGLQAWYGESHILHGVDMRVAPGEVVTLLGRNGAGRTTTLRAILGLTGSRKGSVRIHGTEAIDLPTYKIAHLGIGYCPEERGIFASLSCEENLLLPPAVGG